jgi:hypothetical protein
MNTTTKIILTIFTIILFAGLGASTFVLPHFKANVSLATTAQPEKYTELYFENHLNLPKSAAIKEPQTFSFTLHNLEYKDMVYPYEIYVEDTAGSRSGIITSEVRLRHDESKTITESFEILENIKRAKVVVNLLNKNQEIHFWLGEDDK